MKILNHRVMGPLITTSLCAGWSLLFWKLFFQQLSWEILRIPMGLGGAIYYMFFIKPVIISSAIYEIVVSEIIHFKGLNLKPTNRIIITLLIPILIISITLIIFCPMDSSLSYFEYLWKKRIMN